jgi:hypothetical protein
VRNEEIIYEAGKSLIKFKSSHSIENLISEVSFVSRDILKNQPFAGAAGISDIPLKVGGGNDWTAVSNGMRVNIKMTGALSDGEYIADAVTHIFDYKSGYTTEFKLKRNMLPGDNLPRKPVIEKYAVVNTARANNDNEGTRNKVQGTREDRISR